MRPRIGLPTIAALVASTAAPSTQSPDGDARSWPSFRGERAIGVQEGFELPVRWDVEAGRNVAWRTPIPGLGHSSPAIWGDRLFVTSAVRLEGESELSSLYGSPGYGADRAMEAEGAHSFRLYCLDRTTGEVLWEREAWSGPPTIERHVKSSHANPTPACDADRVVAFFGSEGLYCYDHQGELLWKRDLGRLDSGAPDLDDWASYEWGFASSPVLHGDLVLVQCDVQDQSFIAALDAADGTDVWRTDRDERPTWSTPTVHPTGAGGRPQVIVNGYLDGGGYDLETGEKIWWYSGGGDSPVPTPIVAHGLVFLTSSHGRARPLTAFAVEAEGKVERDADAGGFTAWNLPRRGIYMQTPIVYGDYLYCCSDGGVLGCYDARTGEQVYRERLGTGRTGFSGSAVGGDGKLYFTGETGDVHVVRAGPEFEVLATNSLGETCMSTPALCEGELFFRTRHHVVAIGDRDDELAERVDALFEAWDRDDAPGAVVGVYRGGELAYAKGYGVANLDLGVPLTSRTVLRIGSISKQFVAMCVALLAEEGALDLDDDMRTYLPEMPEYGAPITLRQMLHHTSGLREYLDLVELIGKPEGGGYAYTPSELVALLARQEDLLFEPGEEYSYSNSNYFLLSEVVTRVSGQKTSELAKERIFDPLGMTSTRFADDPTAIVPNRGWGYSPREGGGWRMDILLSEVIGDLGVVTSVEDFLQWDRNLRNNRLGAGSPELIDTMLAPGRLNDGEELGYALGISLGEYRGLRTLGHGGSAVGYVASYLRFPDRDLAVVVFSNDSSFSPGRMARRVADLCLGELPAEASAPRDGGDRPDRERPEPVELSPDELAVFAGDYYSRELHYVYPFEVRDGALVLEVRGRPHVLAPLGDGAFRWGWRRLEFELGDDGAADGFTLRVDEGFELGFRRATNPLPLD